MKQILSLLLALVAPLALFAKSKVPAEKDFAGYLFAYFTGNDNTRDEEAIRFAISENGYDFKALNDNRPVISSADISQTGGVRDPHIMRGPDNCFYMVVTDMVSARGWDSNRAMVLLKSCDLLTWTSSVVNIQQKYSGQEDLKRVWAPQTIWDPKAKKMLVYWSMKHGDGPDIIYYAYANKDFTDIEGTPKPFFIPADGKSCIDGDIVLKDGVYHLFYKTEGHGNGIKSATTRDLTSGRWTEQPDYKQQTPEAVEGAGTFKLIGSDKYILMYDVYMKGGYDFTESVDLVNFRNSGRRPTMNFHPRHGTVIPITAAEMARLREKWESEGHGIGEASVASPNGWLEVAVDNRDGSPSYTVKYTGRDMLLESPLGLTTDYGDFTRDLRMVSVNEHKVSRRYRLDRIKKSDVAYDANALECMFENPQGARIGVEILVSHCNIAFRYNLYRPEGRGAARVMRENTGFRLPSSATAFLTPQSDPMTGWKRTKPSYEEEYVIDVPLDTKSRYGQGFTFPAVFRVGDNGWVMLSETGVDRNYCGSHLTDLSDGVYSIAFPMPGENNGNGTVEPGFALPGHTPWRTITVGHSPRPLAQTTIPWDVVEEKYPASTDYRPGKGTWSWIVWQDSSINKDDIRRFIDLAAEMGFPYTLIDCFWDRNIGRKGIEELIAYGRERGVSPILWYSSSGYWNDIEQSPINLMDNPVSRKKEMKWLRDIGVKAIKVDFFGGDKQETMRLYEDILSDADDHGLMVIFHGCTLPRGWERMYPNYVGSEAVLASENMVFNQHFCDEEAFNTCLHPFIRNTVGSMEFGGCFLNKRLNRNNDGGTTRRTTDVFQLATTVLFQNPVQNFALAPNNLKDVPAVCMDFMKRVPTTWDETRFVDGYPGKYVVLARRQGDTWYLAAVNAGKEPLKLKLDLEMFAGKTVALYKDDKKGEPELTSLKVKENGKVQLEIRPQGGILCIK